jgi:hypothetical protein
MQIVTLLTSMHAIVENTELLEKNQKKSYRPVDLRLLLEFEHTMISDGFLFVYVMSGRHIGNRMSDNKLFRQCF